MVKSSPSQQKSPKKIIKPNDGLIDNIQQHNILDDTWISATSTYNYMMKDPLLDWLKLYHNSSPKQSHKNISFTDNKLTHNFTSYIMEQGNIFETKVMKLITKKFGPQRVAEIHGELSPKNPQKVQETLDAMNAGIPIIHGGVLHNHENKTFGIPDILIRSDWMKFLVKEHTLSADDEKIRAPNLISSEWHYRVIDIKFTSLLLKADGSHLLNTGSFPAYKSQLFIYNQALGLLQGYTPSQVYILGRKWKYSNAQGIFSNDSCFNKLGIIDYQTRDNEYIELTSKALAWINDVRSPNASKWNTTNYPLDRWELYPNMCNTHDYPFRAVKEKIATDSKELTSLWMIGPKNRKLALDEGIYRWTDKKCTPNILGINGVKTSKILGAIIDINRSKKKLISPKYINNNISSWKYPAKIEFFVDFETTNGSLSSIKKLPAANTDIIVAIIGVGYIDPSSNKWVHKNFSVDRLTFAEESRICGEFSNFIRMKSKQHNVKKPNCIHWSSAERIMWSDAMNRHDNEWKSWEWEWMDLLVVFKEEPIVIKGAMNFGLKTIATAMKKHGFIKSGWDKKSSCSDGRGAMIELYKAHNLACDKNTSMSKISTMKQIIRYNMMDVLVLYEIITYIRENHVRRSVTSRKLRTETTPLKKRTRSNDDDIKTSKRRKKSVSMLGEMIKY